MSDLPPIAKCDSVKPEAGYRAQYACVSYLARAEGDFNNGPADKGRYWHAEVRPPEEAEFAEIDLAITIPRDLAPRFRLQSIKAGAASPGKLYSLTFFGTASYGNCKAGKDACVIPKGLSAVVFYK